MKSIGMAWTRRGWCYYHVLVAMAFWKTCSAFSSRHAPLALSAANGRVATNARIPPSPTELSVLAWQPSCRKLTLLASSPDEEHTTTTTTMTTVVTNKSKKRMSRPERKAMERAKKQHQHPQQGRAKKNGATQPFSNGNKKTNNNNKTKETYRLHSTAVSELNKNSPPEHVIRAIKRAQKNHDNHDLRVITRFLLHETDDSYAYGFKGSLLARLAVAALHLQHHASAQQAIEKRRVDFRCSMLPLESAALVRNLLRVHNVTDAWNVLEDELSLPLPGTPLDDAKNKDRLKHRANALASVISRHFFEGEPHQAVYACERLAAMGRMVREAEMQPDELDLPWSRLLRGATQCQAGLRNGEISQNENEPVVNGGSRGSAGPQQQVHADEEHVRHVERLPCNLVYAILNAMLALPSENSDRVYELISNALVRRVVFVTGAVDMEGCPAADRGEAAFVGRSNVGKSSLVNMVTNRKSLAYTSKRPGKTQQFNFFAVNDKPGREKEIRYGDIVEGEKDDDSFYLVDLPGFGFAKVPDQQRQQWASFMDEYISSRGDTLKVLFHLVDARLGPTKEDESIMRRVADILPPYTRYVVILTKADKNVKGPNKTNTGKVSMDVMNHLRQTMDANGVGNAPVVLTSAETKLGRDEVWKYLRLAAER